MDYIDRIRALRKAQGLTQEVFGKSWSVVAKIESSTQAFDMSMETLFKVAEA